MNILECCWATGVLIVAYVGYVCPPRISEEIMSVQCYDLYHLSEAIMSLCGVFPCFPK